MNDLTREIKLVIDSVFEGSARVRLSSENNRTTLIIKSEHLDAVLTKNTIAEGKSYLIMIEKIEDFKDVWSGLFDKNFKYAGTFEIKDTTKEDLKRIRRRLRRLRSR